LAARQWHRARGRSAGKVEEMEACHRCIAERAKWKSYISNRRLLSIKVISVLSPCAEKGGLR
jgi:hypothetical protein